MYHSAISVHRATSKKVFTRVLLALIAIFVGTSPAFSMKPEGCTVLGTWMGYDDSGNASWLSTASGQNTARGVYVLQAPGFDSSLQSSFQDAVLGATMRGAWERIGGHVFSVTLIGIAVKSDGSTLYTAKLNATDTLSEDCNSMLIESSLELFWPNQNPFIDEPFSVSDVTPHYGYRVGVDLPDGP